MRWYLRISTKLRSRNVTCPDKKFVLSDFFLNPFSCTSGLGLMCYGAIVVLSTCLLSSSPTLERSQRQRLVVSLREHTGAGLNHRSLTQTPMRSLTKASRPRVRGEQIGKQSPVRTVVMCKNKFGHRTLKDRTLACRRGGLNPRYQHCHIRLRYGGRNRKNPRRPRAFVV